MAHDETRVQIDLAVQRMCRGDSGSEIARGVRDDKSLCCLSSEVESVEKVHVNRCRHDPMRREQPAQIQSIRVWT